METTPPMGRLGGGGSHPLSLEAEGSLPAARASAPSADRAHTTHYQQRPPLSLGGDAAGCVCVCARWRPISLPNVVAFLSWISLMRPTNSPEPPRSGKFFPKNHFTQDLSPLTERASSTRTVRNHLRQCESSRELVILKLVRCNAINETGKRKKKKDFHRSRVRAAPFPPSLRAGGACASRPGGEEKILVFPFLVLFF